MNKYLFLFVFLLFQSNSTLQSKSVFRKLKNFKNKVKNELNRAARLTNKNIDKFVKRSDDFFYKDQDIFNFITTPKLELEKELQQKIDKFKWAQDQEFINNFSILKNKDAKTEFLIKKIEQLHNSKDHLLLDLADDLLYEKELLKEINNDIDSFINEQKKKKGFLDFLAKEKNNSYFSNLDSIKQKTAQINKNIEIISDFLNELLTL